MKQSSRWTKAADLPGDLPRSRRCGSGEPRKQLALQENSWFARFLPTLICLVPLLSGCASTAVPDNLFDESPVEPQDPTPNACSLEGTFAYFVEVGVGWESFSISPGAGVVRQWLLSRRTLTSDGYVDSVVTCGSGAKGVAVGSPWFATNAFPPLLPEGEWTGVHFLASLWDNNQLPAINMLIEVEHQDPMKPRVGDRIVSPAIPFVHGANLNSAEWPDVANMIPFLQDHDMDGKPGMTGIPFQGEVPGASPAAFFKNPRLELTDPPPRASELFMVLRTRAGLHGQVVSCDPVRLEGGVVPGTLLIETRNVGCTVVGGSPCTTEQNAFIDMNLPQFRANGTSKFVAIKVPDDTNCAQVREIRY